MSLYLYDSATREPREFVPVRPGKAGIYVCGLTTQSEPHIGHVRFAVAFDVLRRWLTIGHGYEVTLIRNVTDLDDKILRKAAESDQEWFALSYANERLTDQALSSLGVLPPTYEPRALGHVTEMIDLMNTLIERGHAYAAPDGSGDVYFDVRSWASYGELTRQQLDDMEGAADADPRGKRDPRDFALWKGAKEGEPASASWSTPFGAGRPGWHLECSAMAAKYLGDTFDIHGGGVDLRFPHHENELAQSRAAGMGFANYWLHNAWVTMGGEKMSKSLGNGLRISEVTKVVRPLAVRYYLTAAHYRSTIEYHEGSLTEAGAAVDRIEGFVRRALAPQGPIEAADVDATIPASFAAAMDDDLGVPGALAVIHEHVRAGNTALDEGEPARAEELARELICMCEVLGINPLSATWVSAGSNDDHAASALSALVDARLDERARAKSERDFARADAIRDELTTLGILIEDTPQGARWSLSAANGA